MLAQQVVWHCLSLMMFFFDMGGSSGMAELLRRRPPLVFDREKVDD